MAVSDLSDISVPKKKPLAGPFAILFIVSMLGFGGWVSWIYLLKHRQKIALWFYVRMILPSE